MMLLGMGSVFLMLIALMVVLMLLGKTDREPSGPAVEAAPAEEALPAGQAAEAAGVAADPNAWMTIADASGLTPEQIAAAALDEDVDIIGLSILSGSHLELVPEVVRLVREAGLDCPVVVGGIIPEDDRPTLLARGVAAVYTPKDFELGRIIGELTDLALAGRSD